MQPLIIFISVLQSVLDAVFKEIFRVTKENERILKSLTNLIRIGILLAFSETINDKLFMQKMRIKKASRDHLLSTFLQKSFTVP